MSSSLADIPWESLALQIAEDCFRERVAHLERFPTGLSHFVVSATTASGHGYVIRIARPERRQELARGLTWHRKLERLSLPLPRIHHTGDIEDCTYAVYDRLKGGDLEIIYHMLGRQTKEKLARDVAQIQEKVGQLEEVDEFQGFPEWADMVSDILRRSEQEILQRGLAQRDYVSRARAAVSEHQQYLRGIRRVPFLYDLNVRNVIVHSGNVSGIVDVDDVWFGDPLLSIGRGKTLLLAAERDTDFIQAWCEYLDLSDEQKGAVDLYAMIYCIRFMGTVGQRLNGNYSIQTDIEKLPVYERVAENLLTGLASG